MHTHQVLVYFSCSNKLPWSVWLKQQICISHSSGKLKINLEADLVSSEDLLSGLQMVVSCYVAKRERK